MFYLQAEEWSDDDIYYAHPMIADIQNVQSDSFVEKHGGDGDATDSDDISLAQFGKRMNHSVRRKLIESCNESAMLMLVMYQQKKP